MRFILRILPALFAVNSYAATATDNGTFNFNFKDTEITQVIEDYAKATGQRFIIDPSIKGKITIINGGPISAVEAFNQLSSAMATNGVGVSKQDDVMIVMQARALQRNYIDVGTELPPLKPDRMFTWIINLKYISADEVNKQLRIITSNHGEVMSTTHNNQLIISDYVSNLYRVAKIMKEIDLPAKSAIKTEKKTAEIAIKPKVTKTQ